MNEFLAKCKNHDLAIFLMRVALGLVFVAHGWQKLNGLEGTIGFFSQLGLPAAIAYLVAFVEFFGGIAMLLGIFVEYAAILIAVVMATAIYLVKMEKGFLGGYELDLSLLLAALAVFFAGSGRYTVMRLFKKSQQTAPPMQVGQ